MRIRMKWMLRSFLVSSILTFTVFSFLFFSETGQFPSFPEQIVAYLLATVFVTIGSVILYFTNSWLDDKVSWNKKRGLRFLIEFIIGFFVFSLLAFVYFQIYLKKQLISPNSDPFLSGDLDAIIKFYIILSVLLYVYSLVNFSIYSYRQYSEAQLAGLKQERHQLSLQFQALRSQLSPHFLFNALNTISSLSSRNIEKAEEYIRKLADVYRYILKSEEQALVLLSDEINLLESFFFLQQIKYENWIQLDIKLSKEVLESYIPALTLQMLLENAIKHNSVCEERYLKIEFTNNSKHIIIQNNLNDDTSEIASSPPTSHKLGLKNIEKRYSFFTDEKLQLNKNDFFIVSLPIIHTS